MFDDKSFINVKQNIIVMSKSPETSEVLEKFDRAFSLVERGEALVEAGSFQEAISLYDQGIEVFPAPPFYCAKGDALNAFGLYEEAVECHDLAIRRNAEMGFAEEATPFINKSVALGNLGRYAEALEAANHAIELDPEKASAHNSKGISLEEMGREEEALAAYDRAIEINPNYAIGYGNKAGLLVKMRDDRGALDCLNKACSAAKANSELQAKDPDYVKSLGERREEMLEKVAKLQQAAVDTEELVAGFEKGAEKDADKNAQSAMASIVNDLESLNEERSLLFGGISGLPASDSPELAAQINEMYNRYVSLQNTIAEMQKELNSHSKEIDSLKLSQQQIADITSDLKKKGVHDLEKVWTFLEKLQDRVDGVVPSEIAEDQYMNAFYCTLKADLNSTHLAASSVQSDILSNGKKGQFGNLGHMFHVVGEYVPTVGGGVMLLGAMLSLADQRQQDVMVKKFASMASGSLEMDAIASNIAYMLAQSEFDKSQIGGPGGDFAAYLTSMFKDVSGAKSKKAASSAAVDVVQKMGVVAAESAYSKGATKFKFGFSSVWKKKAAADDVEEVKSSCVDFKSQGEKDAHLVASIVISKIYKGEIFACRDPQDTAKMAVCGVLGHFGMDAGMVEVLAAACDHNPSMHFSPDADGHHEDGATVMGGGSVDSEEWSVEIGSYA